MRTTRRLLPITLLGVLALAGCTAAPPAPTGGPTGGATPASTVPSPSTVPPTTAAPSATPTAAGCAATRTRPPADARFALAGDLDGDGRDDRILSAPAEHLFGIATASGAVLTVHDPLAGPAAHTAWAARIAGGATVLVLADGRGARLYALQRSGSSCSIGPVRNAQGAQYEFDQQELRGHGTGVGCRPQDGALQLGGYDAHPIGGDRFRVTFTRVTVSPDGRTAVNGPSTVVAASAAADSATVRIANDSTCASVPILGVRS